MSLLTYHQFLKESEYTPTQMEQLFEGGAYGQIPQPFEDMSMTFGALKDLIITTIYGSFAPENFVSEKTDGWNLLISWKNGRLVAARNKSHLRNFGENALEIGDMSNMFPNRAGMGLVFQLALEDLSKAFGGLEEVVLSNLFQNGKIFASVEIITKQTQNIISYGQDMIVLHSLRTYNEKGEVLGEEKSMVHLLCDWIKITSGLVQTHFYIRPPKIIEPLPIPDAPMWEKKFLDRLLGLLSDTNLTWANTLGDYVLVRGRNYLKDMLQKDMLTLTPNLETIFTQRIFLGEKKHRVTTRDLGVTAKWVKDIEKNQGVALRKAALQPIADLFLLLGVLFLRNTPDFLSANPMEATLKIRQELEMAIRDIEMGGEEQKISKLRTELERFQSIGGLEALVPSEGVTFKWKDKHYKYTGVFALIHKIRSLRLK
jgi:hypothetical protein